MTENPDTRSRAERLFQEYVDLENLIDYMIINQHGGNGD